jgi:hypothetical protein
MKIDPRFKDTEFVVEADSYARQTIWEQWSTQAMFKRPNCNNINWEQDSMGCVLQIGTLDNRPVNIEFYWAKLIGHLVLFYHPCSQVVDHAMIETWIKKYCNPQWDNGRRAHCDASNFHHVISYIRETAAKRLINDARTHADEGNPDDAAMRKIMHPLNNPIQITVDKPIACVPVKREGNKLILDGSIQIARDDTLWALLPKQFQVMDGNNNPIPPSGKFLITVESIDPYHLVADI